MWRIWWAPNNASRGHLGFNSAFKGLSCSVVTSPPCVTGGLWSLGLSLRSCKFLCLWFRASLIYINNCPTRFDTKQSIYYSAISVYMFRVSTTPIITSTQNCNYSLRYCAATSLQRGQWPRWRKVAAQKIWPVPEAVVRVLCTPNDGCGWHLKHVEWTCRVINRLLCVASRWTIINIVM